MAETYDTLKVQVRDLWDNKSFDKMHSAMKMVEDAYGSENLKACLSRHFYEEQDEMFHDMQKAIQQDWSDIKSAYGEDIMSSEARPDDAGDFGAVTSEAVEAMKKRLEAVKKIRQDPTPIWDVRDAKSDPKPLTADQFDEVLSDLDANISGLRPLQKTIHSLWGARGAYHATRIVNDAYNDMDSNNDFAIECLGNLDAHTRDDAIQYLADTLDDNADMAKSGGYDAGKVADINRRLNKMHTDPAFFYYYTEADEYNEADLSRPTPMDRTALMSMVYYLVYDGEAGTAKAWQKAIDAIIQ